MRYSEAVAILLPDSVTFARPEVIGTFVVFLIVLAAVIGVMWMVFHRR